MMYNRKGVIMATHLGNSWDEKLKAEIEKPYFNEIRNTLLREYKTHTIYPPKNEILAAFQNTAFEDVKVVIIGQDPYHGEGQANGLAFSVNKGIALPPSLQNIYKALEYDLGIKPAQSGDLTPWAKQGVLLLNASLTVQEGNPMSHSKIGWDIFTDAVIKMLNESNQPIVFMLWGNFARKKKELITNKNHLILESVHPSPLSFSRGFLQCKHFSKANEYLVSKGVAPIDWRVEK